MIIFDSLTYNIHAYTVGKFVYSHLTNFRVDAWDGMDNQQLHHHEGSWKHSLNFWTRYGNNTKVPAGTQNTTPVIWPTTHPNSGTSQTNSKFAHLHLHTLLWISCMCICDAHQVSFLETVMYEKAYPRGSWYHPSSSQRPVVQVPQNLDFQALHLTL